MSHPFARRDLLRTAVLVAGVGVTTSACTGPLVTSEDGTAVPPPDHEVVPRADGAVATIDGGVEPSVAASEAVLDRSTAAVVSTPDAGSLAAADAAARALGLPLLVQGPDLLAELDRLQTRTVIGYAAGAPAETSSPDALGDREVVEGGPVADLPELPGLPREADDGSAVVLLQQGAELPSVLGPLLALTGAVVVPVTDADPRRDEASREALVGAMEAPVLAVGDDVGPSERMATRVRTARRATDLPGGGLLPFPGRRMVALYGHPSTGALGMLGEQSPGKSVQRVSRLAEEYAGLTDTTVIPAFELIATVAAASPMPDGTYSRRTPVDVLLPWVEAAEESGTYVVLDLQPGRSDFLTQARTYEPLLRRPWVGLALDPEWRLKPGQKHIEQIGSVGIAEVNAVGAWLAELVRTHDLPPKVLTLHQFRTSMVRDRERLDTSLDEVQWLVHADGQGGQGDKQATWRALKKDLPEGVWLGWKNFEDEDAPMLTPEQTMEEVDPTPWFISYQ
ncbi:MAG: hypothetical protein WBL35_11310 [Ornithinibacter sp.]